MNDKRLEQSARQSNQDLDPVLRRAEVRAKQLVKRPCWPYFHVLAARFAAQESAHIGIVCQPFALTVSGQIHHQLASIATETAPFFLLEDG